MASWRQGNKGGWWSGNGPKVDRAWRPPNAQELTTQKWEHKTGFPLLKLGLDNSDFPPLLTTARAVPSRNSRKPKESSATTFTNDRLDSKPCVASSSSVSETTAEVQARRNMRVLDFLAATDSNPEATELVKSLSKLAQVVSAKDTKNILQRELHELMVQQCRLVDVLQSAPSVSKEGGGCDPALLAAMIIRMHQVMNTQFVAAEPAEAEREEGSSKLLASKKVEEKVVGAAVVEEEESIAEDSIAEGDQPWVLEPPHGGSWDWPLSRLETKERIIMLSQINLVEEVEELRAAANRKI